MKIQYGNGQVGFQPLTLVPENLAEAIVLHDIVRSDTTVELSFQVDGRTVCAKVKPNSSATNQSFINMEDDMPTKENTQP